MTKLIIAGSRSIEDMGTVFDAIDLATWEFGDIAPNNEIEEIVHGGCSKGVDRMAKAFAARREIPENVFEADWDKHGKAAGPIRNKEMAEYGDKLVAIWDGESSGTRDMIDKALDQGLDVHVENLDTQGDT